MLNVERLVEYQARGVFTRLSPLPGSTGQPQTRFGEGQATRHLSRSERAVDQILADSFPASDPPPWTPGMARPTRRTPSSAAAVANEGVTSEGAKLILEGIGSLVGAVGIALLFPFAILMIGLPVALAVRAVVEVVPWLAALIFG